MRIVKILLAVFVVVALAPYVIAPFYRTGHPVSTLMAWRSLRGAPMQREWIDLAEMSPYLPRAVVAAEDAHFCKHHGIDWGALREAIDDAQEDGTPFRGASTITQQVAKNLFLWQGRDFVRKALEFPLALWIDFVLPKPRILEIYLNVAEFGPRGQFGVEAGSAFAFGKSAASLSRERRPFWPPSCQIRSNVAPKPPARVSGGWRQPTWRGGRRTRLRSVGAKIADFLARSGRIFRPKSLALRPAFLYKRGLDRHSARLVLRVLSRPFADDALMTPIPRGY